MSGFDVFPTPDALRVALVGGESLGEVAGTLSDAHRMTVEILDSDGIPDDLLVAGGVPDCVVTASRADADAVAGVLDRPVVVYADLSDDAVASLVADADWDYVPPAADTATYDLLASRVRRLASAHRREAELSLRAAAMDQAGVGITIADARTPDDVLIYANEGFEVITGYPRSAVIGRNCRFLQGPDTDPDTVAQVRAALEANEPVSVDLLNYDTENRPFWNQLDITTVEDDDGEVTHYFGFQKDITERKRLEERLERENERLSTFASVVSHDLRNPLAVARGGVETVRNADGESRADLDRVDAALDRMETLIEDVLTLARQGEVVDEPERTSLPTVVSRAWSTVDAPDASLELDDDLGVVLADPERLRTLFENLFRNAVQHGGSDVSIRVGALTDGFYVEDDGPGIPADERSQAFEQGFTTHEEGSGLGLAIVESIATAHGWSADVEAAPAGGARFVFADVEAA